MSATTSRPKSWKQHLSFTEEQIRQMAQLAASGSAGFFGAWLALSEPGAGVHPALLLAAAFIVILALLTAVDLTLLRRQRRAISQTLNKLSEEIWGRLEEIEPGIKEKISEHDAQALAKEALSEKSR